MVGPRQKNQNSSASSDEDWSAGLEDRSVSGGWSSLLGRELGELKIWLQELSSLISEDLIVGLDDGLNDEDGLSLGAVSTGHFVVHLGHGTAESVVSVLLVHVDHTSSSQVLQHDSVVLDGVRFALKDFADTDDLTLALSNLVLTLHFIPELGSGNHGVLSEDSDSVASGVWVGLRWVFSSDNPVLSDL